MSEREVKQVLRKMDYPLCAKEALNNINQLLCGRAPNIKLMDLALDLMSEFVFCEVDRRGNKTPAFNPIQELQLLEVLYDFLNETEDETHCNTVFMNLFSGTTATQRLKILNKLVSIALGTNAPKILNSASTWMQQLGNTSTNSCKLAENIITDYFILLPKSLENIHELPVTCPQFTANFLTAIGELYFVEGSLRFPPSCLLEAVTNWIMSDHSLCIAAQTMQHPLPPGAIAMEATTPIAGLLKWTVLAPIYKIDSPVYEKLHLGLLNSIFEIPVLPTPRAVSATALTQSNGGILKYVMDLEKKAKLENVDRHLLVMRDESLLLSLERYAQIVQVALTKRCIYGNIDDLIVQMSFLPQTHIVRIVIENYKRKE
ncbi:integrator complex subunit 15 [Atheta coriaria]|uniref:integrator complex subunit 15 n=1 Tax=Dalotia coriaria TaxID=877792 RepID=UPI0031F44D1A